MLGGATEKPALNFLVLDLSVDSIGSGLSVKALSEKLTGCLLGIALLWYYWIASSENWPPRSLTLGFLERRLLPKSILSQ